MSFKCKLGFHTWDGCKCFQCDKIRDKQHFFVNDICKICRKGTLTDTRDGNQYKIIKIDSQIIMAENLRYKVPNGDWIFNYKLFSINKENAKKYGYYGCWAFNNYEENAKKYGYLYNWKTAKKAAEGMEGWHLPSESEWKILYNYLGGNNKMVYKAVIDGGNSGFNALLGGGSRHDNGRFSNAHAEFWSSSNSDIAALCFCCYAHNGQANLSYENFNCGISVRLFKDI